MSGQKVSFYKEDGSSLTKPLGHVFDAGIVFQPDDENIFEITGHYLSQNSDHQGSSDISLLDDEGQYEYKLHRITSYNVCYTKLLRLRMFS